MKTQTSTSGQRRTSAKPSTGEVLPKPRKSKAVKPPKPKPEPLRYDFADGYRGSMALLVNNATQKTKRRWITLTEWPASLIQAYDAGILYGEADVLGKAMKAMTDHPWRRALTSYRKPTLPHIPVAKETE